MGAPIGGASAVNPGAEAGLPCCACEGGGACGVEPGLGGPGGAAPGWFIINIVPLNFGAAAVFSAKPHFAHSCAVSVF